MPLSSSSVRLQTVMLTHPEFWCQCPDREQTASLFSAQGQIKIPTLNYSEHSLQAVWVPKWFAFLTHYCLSQAFLKKCTWRVFRWCLQPVWHITCAQQLKLALFVCILISYILRVTEMTDELPLICIRHNPIIIWVVCCNSAWCWGTMQGCMINRAKTNLCSFLWILQITSDKSII